MTFSVACGAMLSFWEAEPSPEQPAHQHVVEKGWVLELQWEQVTDLVDGPAADTTRPNLVPEVAHLKKMPAKMHAKTYQMLMHAMSMGDAMS